MQALSPVLAQDLINCRTGNTITSVEAEVQNRNGVLKALGDEGNQLRKSLGESLASREKFNQPLEEATTSSLEAFQAYTHGRRIAADTGSAEAIPFYQFIEAIWVRDASYGSNP